MHDELKYSVMIRGKDFGPFGVKRLQEFVDRGQIEPATFLVSTRGDRIQASAVPRLRFQVPVDSVEPDPDLVQRFGKTEPKPFLKPATEALTEPMPPGSQTDPSFAPPSLAEEKTQLLRLGEPTDPGFVAPSLAEEKTQLLQMGEPTDPGFVLPSLAEEKTQLLQMGEPTDPGFVPPSLADEPTQLLEPDKDARENADEATVLEAVDLETLEEEFARREVERQGSAEPQPDAAGSLEQTAGGTKPCPFCQETIQASAMKCRFCAEWL